MAKKRIVKDYHQLPPEILSAVKKKYPLGYADHLTTYASSDGKIVSSLPFETEDVYYLIRMSIQEAKRLAKQEEEEFEDEGKSPLANLKDDFKMDDLDLDQIPEDEADDEYGDDEEDEEDSLIIKTRKDKDDDDDSDEDY